MGTRGLTAVMFDGEYKIAQYGQWDHYPDGQGVVALEFCRKWLTDPVKSSQFASALHACRFVTEDEIKQAYDAAKTPEEKARNDGFIGMDTVARFQKRFPLVDRDHGARILELVANGTYEPELKNSIDFAADSVFCEYAYVIDVDSGTFEVYKGFNDKGAPVGERFASLPPRESNGSGNTYYPVRLWRQWRLDDLPSKSEFLRTLKEKDE